MDLRGFAARMQATANAVADNADKLMRKVALAVDTAVVTSTPVDTGRARSNWQVALGQAASGVKYWPQPAKPSSPAEGQNEALTQAQLEVAQYREGITIHITNNLPYIAELNRGSSAQAPANYVEMAVIAAKEAIDQNGNITATVTTERI